jgi:hypothetical protein
LKLFFLNSPHNSESEYALIDVPAEACDFLSNYYILLMAICMMASCGDGGLSDGELRGSVILLFKFHVNLVFNEMFKMMYF